MKRVFWVAASIAFLALCGLLLFPSSPLRPGGRAKLPVSSAEAILLFERNAAEFRGVPRLSVRQAIKDRAHLAVCARLLFGAKLTALVTTNASLGELAKAFATYSPFGNVIVPGEAQDISAPRFGKFDSGRYVTRWRAAGAIDKLLRDAGWRVEQLADGKIIFLSPSDHELLLAAKSPPLQEKLAQKFDQAEDSADKQHSAHNLSRLWRTGFLADQTKRQLVERHYRLVLRQLPKEWPSWEVRIEPLFPFPHVWTDFTPTLYQNGRVKWSPGRPQTSRAMDDAGKPSGDPIASMGGGEFRNGDVLQCKIDLAQKVDGQPWQITLWTDKVVLQGLKH